MHIRTADLSEAEPLARLINQAFVVERFFIDGERVSVEDVRQRFGKGQFLVAERDGALAACVYLEPRGERAYLGLLSVDPACQGAGLGRRLMEAAENHARAQGCRAIDLNIVNLRVGLPSFYQKCGYVENGTAPFPSGAVTKLPCHFLRMTKAI